MASLQRTVRTILQKAYCTDLDIFVKEVYQSDHVDAYHENKFSQMKNNFIHWFCELDTDHAERFCQFATKDLNETPMGKHEEEHEGIKCSFNNESTLVMIFPYNVDSDYKELLSHIASEQTDFTEIGWENDKRFVIYDAPRETDLKKLCVLLQNGINEMCD